MAKIKTNISQVYWCKTNNNIAKVDRSKFKLDEDLQGREIAWFDEMLEGGLESFEDELEGKFENKVSPTTILISGPPGSGKTTLALELCYRMAKESNKLSQYISTESDTKKLIQNAISFGYKGAEDIILEDIRSKNIDRNYMGSFVIVTGKDKLAEKEKEILEQFESKKENKSKVFNQILDFALEVAANKILGGGSGKKVLELKKKIVKNDDDEIIRYSPDVLVIDSLNIIEEEERQEFFQKFIQETKYSGMGFLVCIVDDPTHEKHSSWAHVCDIVIDLNYTRIKEYYLRTIEIVKARYQSHVWGKHQIKIYPKKSVSPPTNEVVKDFDQLVLYNQNLRRLHPYREEGGIFIYPSVHYFLSQYKKVAHIDEPYFLKTKLKNLNKIIEFPEGRCTAFFGCRGAHKSHLAFLHLLYRIYEKNEKGIIVSLRDDEEMTKRTLGRIIVREFPKEIECTGDYEKDYKVALKSLAGKINENKLEILYYHPGYITPEEFFHRVYLSVQKLKGQHEKTSLIFNSLDQLSARFPLCAKQEIFIPSIVTALTGEKVTSIFIAVDEPGQPRELYGLLPLADLVISFYRHLFSFKDYFTHLSEKWNVEEWEKEEIAYFKKTAKINHQMEKSKIDAVVMEVVRFAGGKRAGARGILELVHQKEINESLYKEAGLQFTELSKKASHGEPIGTYRFPRI